MPLLSYISRRFLITVLFKNYIFISWVLWISSGTHNTYPYHSYVVLPLRWISGYHIYRYLYYITYLKSVKDLKDSTGL